MAPQLPSTTQIENFLKDRGEPANFTARRKRFNELGIDRRMGEFTGTPAQNRALRRSIEQATGVAQEAARVAGLPEFQPGAVVTPAGEIQATERGRQLIAGRTPAQVQAEATRAVEQARRVAPEPTFTERIRERVPTVGEPFALADIPTPAAPTPEDILRRARGETAVQFAEQEAEAARARIPAQIEQGISDVKANFASRGLVFSGARTQAEQDVRDQALVEQLNIDLRFAKVLGGAIDRAATELGREIEDVIEDARDQRQEEIDFLADLGLAVNPQTGELFQTLASLREQRISEAEEPPRTQLRSVGGRELLVDLNTGDILRDLGPSKLPGAAPGPAPVPEFSRSEQLKLEQAGLTDAPREEQLDLLFGEEEQISKEDRRLQQFEDARNIAIANIEERGLLPGIFASKGKLKKGVTQPELENTIRKSTGLPISDIRNIIKEVLAIENIGKSQ